MNTFDTVIISEIRNESDDLTIYTNNEFLSFHVPIKPVHFIEIVKNGRTYVL